MTCIHCGYPINPGAANHPDCVAKRIKDLEDILDLRDAATESLCIAVHGEVVQGATIYSLIHDVAALRKREK